MRVCIVAVDEEPSTFRGKDGTERKVLACAVSDGCKVVRVVCYASNLFGRLKVGSSIAMREVIRKTDARQPYIVMTEKSKVFATAAVSHPASHTDEGTTLLNPLPAADVPIATALSSPSKQKNSVVGKIVQEEAPRTIRVNDEEVTIKVVKVEDSTSNCNVTLWRAAAAADVRPGDYIRVTDVIVNHYNGSTSLSTTARTKIEKTEVPVSERDVVVVGACVDGATVDLLLDDDTEVKVPVVMMQGLVGDEDIEEASAAGLQVHITSQGPDIVSLELIEEALMLG
ncbi:uncharacterized protein LOC127833612 [Dreissena polymorpha]|nr:uncharacterized protein LOC127833612 [Dreissena polymorpha]